MAKKIFYVVQPYDAAKRGNGLKAGAAMEVASEAEARRKAERLAPLREGVVAFAASADVELGDYDENPDILFKAGRLPFPFDQA
ncbi:MAG: hypothetical protein B7Y78_08805 [Caulobacter sp. 35-67-4]|nr:MAG: hypothetical protein B7Y78_08805 [Caulobacter sp. 35-67-4]